MSDGCRAGSALSPVAFVTGSSADRIGKAVALHLANAKYRLVIHANRSVEEGVAFVDQLQKLGTDSMLVQGPIEEEDRVESWIEQIDARFGRLDALVHASAIWEPIPLEATRAEDVRHFLDVNLIGSFLCAKHAGLYMAKQPQGGSIVLIGDWAIERPYRDFTGYLLSKGAIPTLTRAMAVELADRNRNVRVNAILPGPVLLHENASEELYERVRNQSLLHRTGAANDIAAAAYFLLNQPFVTGTCLPVDGGRSIYSPHDDEAIAHPKVTGEPKALA